jgi:hypothetical protein
MDYSWFGQDISKIRLCQFEEMRRNFSCADRPDDQNKYKKSIVNHSNGANIWRCADLRGYSRERSCQVNMLIGCSGAIPSTWPSNQRKAKRR